MISIQLLARPLALALAAVIACPHAVADEVIRIMAANTTSGNNQSYDPGEGIRIFQGLDPDIVLIQEFNYFNGSFESFVDTAFGPEFTYFREGINEQIPNGVISRYPILQSGEWIDAQVGNRDFVWARIDIPGAKDLWAVSVHFLTLNETVRNAQATALVGFIQANIPAADYLVVGGDFNTGSFAEPALVNALSAVVDTSGRPSDQNGDTGTNSSRAKPYDQVLPDPDLNLLETAVVIGGHSFSYPDGLVFDSRVFTPLSAAPPVLSGDSSATNMQHMAVIRDFRIPTGAGPAEPGAHVTNFAGTPAMNSISLSWTDSAMPPSASGYLIKASMNPSIIAPIDGVLETADTNLSDGSATLLIPSGQQTAAFAGLPTEATYHFKIYPYSSGNPINYKTNSSVPSLVLTTLPDTGTVPAAPVLGSTYYPHSAGFTVTWNQVPSATDYRLDVSESPTFSGGTSTLLSENFDASSVVPATWTDGATANDTQSIHYRSASNCRALGAADTLITPAVNFPSNLSFYVDSSSGGNGMTATVSYSVNNGTWLPLSSFAVSTTLTLKTISLISSPKLDNVSNVRFRFESSFSTWYLDDVIVTSTAAPAFVNGYQNLSVGNYTHRTVSGLDPAETYYYRVRAVNQAGPSPNSGTGNETTRATGSPYIVWAGDRGIAPASFTSDFDKDSLPDFEEYLFATDPKQNTSQAEQLQLSTANGDFRVTFRRSLAPGILWTHQGNMDLSAIGTDLIQGLGYAQYQIVSVVRMGDYEEVTLTVNKASDSSFFYRIKAAEGP